jgi:hypothetical protein
MRAWNAFFIYLRFVGGLRGEWQLFTIMFKDSDWPGRVEHLDRFSIPQFVYMMTAGRFQEFRDGREFREKKMMGAAERWVCWLKTNRYKRICHKLLSETPSCDRRVGRQVIR